MPKKLMIWAGILSLLCWFLLISPVSHVAHAASLSPQTYPAMCSGTGCDGLDPYASNVRCAGYSGDSWRVLDSVYIYDHTGANIGYVQLWWSDTCKTNWSRLVCTNCGGGVYTAELHTGTNPGPLVESKTENSVNDIHSPQKYLPTTLAYACGMVEEALVESACTNSY